MSLMLHGEVGVTSSWTIYYDASVAFLQGLFGREIDGQFRLPVSRVLECEVPCCALR